MLEVSHGNPTIDMLASGANDVKLWIPSTGVLHMTLPHNVICVAWSRSGNMLASAGFDYTIKIWNPTAVIPLLRTLTGHTDMVYSVAWSPTRDVLASGSTDTSIKLWDPVAGTLLRTLPGHEGFGACLAWNPDGDMLASGSVGGGSVYLWPRCRVCKLPCEKMVRGNQCWSCFKDHLIRKILNAPAAEDAVTLPRLPRDVEDMILQYLREKPASQKKFQLLII